MLDDTMSPIGDDHSPTPNPNIEVTFAETMDVASNVHARHGPGAFVVFLVLTEGFRKEGPLYSETVSDAASMYGWCVQTVLDSAIYMEQRGLVRLEEEPCPEGGCNCYACRSHRISMSLPYNFGIDANIAEQQQQARKLHNSESQERKANDATGIVYLLKAGSRFKIGRTRDIRRRMAQLSQQAPFPLELIHHVNRCDSNELEACLHRQFHHQREHGEWFEFSPDQLASVVETMNEWL